MLIWIIGYEYDTKVFRFRALSFILKHIHIKKIRKRHANHTYLSNVYRNLLVINTTRRRCLYILIDLEIHIIFTNLNKIYKFSFFFWIIIYKSGSFLSDMNLCIFNKEIYTNPYKSIIKSNLLINMYDWITLDLS